MDFESKKSTKNPYATANPFSKLFFLWIIPLFVKGAKKTLEPDDLYDTLKDDLAEPLGDLLQKNWNAELEKAKLKGKKPNFLSALFASFGTRYILAFIPMGITECVFRVSQSLALRYLVRSFTSADVSNGEQYLLAAAVTGSTLITTMTFHPALYDIYRTAMKCRIACSSLVYRKCLKLSKAAQGKTTVGQLVNILASDCNRFDLNLMFAPYIFFGPIQLIIFAYFFWVDFGISALAGLAVVVVLMPVQYWNGKMSTIYRRQIAEKTDERGRIMNEIIIAIRVIKMYAWEKPFSNVIDNIRRLEVKVLRKRSYLRGLYLSVYSSAIKLVPFLTFLAFVLSSTENKLTADKVFFLVAAYQTAIQSTTYMIPSAAAGLGEVYVSLKRIQEFLMLDEKAISSNTTPEKQEEPLVSFKAATVSWTGEKSNLNAIDLDISGNKVVVVVGPVGSGKTTLLHAILDELTVSSGTFKIKGRLSYASQEAWIFAGNIRQNILFGLEYDDERYQNVVTVAALRDDFKQLPHGDMTIVGDRGVSLSGGQKARINLARALYQPADIYLMDDPLSAVDTKVSRHLFEKCIKKHLDGHLRILVTHQLNYLPNCDHIVVMNDGAILAQGTYDELVERGIDFVSLMASDADDAANRKESVVRQDAVAEPTNNLKEGELAPETASEKMAEGSIGLGIYWDYFKTAKSNSLFVILTSVFFITQINITAAELWLSIWTNAEVKKLDGDEENYLGQSMYLWVYTGLVISILVLNMVRSLGFFTYCMKISINMHNWMFGSLVRAPTKFFDDNPSGRIMNRFTKDLGSCDELLPPTFFDMLIIFFQMAGVVTLVIVSNFYMALPAVIILIVLYILRRYYVQTARAVKRIEGVTKSPVFTHSSTTFQGLTTIRAARAEGKLTVQFDAYQDIHSSTWFIFFSTARCFGVWVEMASIIFLAIVTFGFLLLQSSDGGGNVGLAVSSALSLSGWFQFGMRQSAEVENLMTSVERSVEYAKLEAEAPLESKPDKQPPETWPEEGMIRMNDVSLAYGETDVLKNLTFDIKGKEKIGIVGRTGAGKSSIISALFRMTEPRGDIYIDAIRVNDIGLHDLRKVISIIPQDPVLFSGSMRYNLDPFNNYPDEDLWRALSEVELKDAVPALDYLVADGGSNFSVGQRQLVCLARAILRKNKIIVMDEATANVDPRTDGFIQKTIRTKFADCSIITIAHRLHSVIDCDRILVLDNGYLKEYDHPYVLLQNREGILTSMVSHMGKSSGLMLRKIAAETYNGRKGSFSAASIKDIQAALDQDSENEDKED